MNYLRHKMTNIVDIWCRANLPEDKSSIGVASVISREGTASLLSAHVVPNPFSKRTFIKTTAELLAVVESLKSLADGEDVRIHVSEESTLKLLEAAEQAKPREAGDSTAKEPVANILLHEYNSIRQRLGNIEWTLADVANDNASLAREMARDVLENKADRQAQMSSAAPAQEDEGHLTLPDGCEHLPYKGLADEDFSL